MNAVTNSKNQCIFENLFKFRPSVLLRSSC